MPKRVSVREFIANQLELASGEDRGAGLAAAGLLEHYLALAIQSKFRTISKTQSARIFRGYGPLANFAVRIEIAYCLSIINGTQRRDLNHIKWVRNKFAHRSDSVDFDTDYIRDRIRKFSNFREKPILETDCRKVYIDAVMGIISHLVTSCDLAPLYDDEL